MSDLWLPGAERYPLGDTAPTDTQFPARAIWHITWDKNASAARPSDLLPFNRLVSYFTGSGKASAPHLLWDPFGGRVAQFYPATSRSKSVVDAPGGTRTNRTGKVCIQVEQLFFPHCRVGGRSYATMQDTPAKNLDKIVDWLRSWGVPDAWPMGSPTWKAARNERTWASKGGHYGHSQVPENTHTDPGPMPAWPGGRTVPPFPGKAAFGPGKTGEHILRLGERLVAKGCGSHYKVGPSRSWGEADRLNVRAFQLAQGWTGAGADGYPGPETWARLWS